MGIIKLKGYNDIYYVDGFFEEYKSLFGKSADQHKKNLNKLMTNLGILDIEKRKAVLYQHFEQIKDTKLYSIRHVSRFNDRVIYALITPEEHVVLVTSFKEKNTAQDYKAATDRAEARLKKEGLSWK